MQTPQSQMNSPPRSAFAAPLASSASAAARSLRSLYRQSSVGSSWRHTGQLLCCASQGARQGTWKTCASEHGISLTSSPATSSQRHTAHCTPAPSSASRASLSVSVRSAATAERAAGGGPDCCGACSEAASAASSPTKPSLSPSSAASSGGSCGAAAAASSGAPDDSPNWPSNSAPRRGAGAGASPSSASSSSSAQRSSAAAATAQRWPRRACAAAKASRPASQKPRSLYRVCSSVSARLQVASAACVAAAA